MDKDPFDESKGHLFRHTGAYRATLLLIHMARYAGVKKVIADLENALDGFEKTAKYNQELANPDALKEKYNDLIERLRAMNEGYLAFVQANNSK